MKKVALMVILASLFLVSLSGLDERGSAVIYTIEGNRITTDEILVNFGKKWNVSLEINGERQKSNIEINSIKTIEIYKWDTDDEWWMEGKIVIDGKESDGYTFLANPDSLFKRDNKDYIVYRKVDPVNNELVKNRLWCDSVKKIVFDDEKGQWKVDSAGNKYSPEYMYSPYTGEKLKFGRGKTIGTVKRSNDSTDKDTIDMGIVDEDSGL